MGMFFPNRKELSQHMFGVTPEDQERWDKQKAAEKAKGDPGLAQTGLMNAAASLHKAGMMMAQSQLMGREAANAMDDNERERGAKRTRRVVTETETTSYPNSPFQEDRAADDDMQLG